MPLMVDVRQIGGGPRGGQALPSCSPSSKMTARAVNCPVNIQARASLGSGGPTLPSAPWKGSPSIRVVTAIRVPPFVGLQFGHLYSGGRCEEVPKVPSRWPRRRSGGAPCGRPSRDLRPCPKSADGSSMKGMNVRTLASSQTLRSVPVALGVGSPGHRLDRLGPLLHELLTWDLVYRSESGAFLLRDDLQQRLDEMSLLQTRSTTQVYVGRPCEHCGVVAVTRLVDGTRACAACRESTHATPVPERTAPLPSLGHGRHKIRYPWYRKAG